MAWLCQQAKVLWPSFYRSGLGAVGAHDQWVSGDSVVKPTSDFARAPCVHSASLEQLTPLAQGVDGPLERKTARWDLIALRDVLHECANQVVSDGVHRALFLNHGRCLAPEHVHAQRDLDVAKE